MNRKAALAVGASFGMAFLAACSDSPTAPAAAKVEVPKTSFQVGDTPALTPTAVTGKIVVCKTGNVGGSFSFTRSTEGPNIVGSTYIGNGPVNIANGTCLEIADDDSPSGSGSHITITEAAAANTVQTITACSFRGYQLDGVTLNPPVSCTYVNGGDLFLNHFHGYVITYNNVFTPPTGNEGCTPGYWKQTQHFGNWPVSLNTTLAGAGFTFYSPGSTTLLTALGLNGGDLQALARHAAAAYLNSLSSGVDFAYTTAQVIAIANGTGAYAGLTVEARKNLLAAANEGVGGCPLARAELS